MARLRRRRPGHLVVVASFTAVTMYVIISSIISCVYIPSASTANFHNEGLHNFELISQSTIDYNKIPALQVWKEYQDNHSHQRLIRMSHSRTYQVVYYSCPHSAGNILHDFLNQVLVAIALNRTMLVKYNDKETCEYLNEGYSFILRLTDRK